VRGVRVSADGAQGGTREASCDGPAAARAALASAEADAAGGDAAGGGEPSAAQPLRVARARQGGDSGGDSGGGGGGGGGYGGGYGGGGFGGFGGAPARALAAAYAASAAAAAPPSPPRLEFTLALGEAEPMHACVRLALRAAGGSVSVDALRRALPWPALAARGVWATEDGLESWLASWCAGAGARWARLDTLDPERGAVLVRDTPTVPARAAPLGSPRRTRRRHRPP